MLLICDETRRIAANVAKLAELVRSIRPVAPELEGLFCRRRKWRIKALNEEDAFLFVISICGCIGEITHDM